MADMSSQPFTIRLAYQDDLPQVCEIDDEAFSPYGTGESPKVIATRLAVFPAGFVVLEKDGVVLGYGSSEKWLHDREPALNEDPSTTHHPLGRVFCITAMAVRRAFWKQGFGSAILDGLIFDN
jgi:acetyltransferase (GNAT) family protein